MRPAVEGIGQGFGGFRIVENPTFAICDHSDSGKFRISGWPAISNVVALLGSVPTGTKAVAWARFFNTTSLSANHGHRRLIADTRHYG